ncbi:MAG: glycosyltransferase family 4 protein [Pseudomonadota bacterium]
MASGARPIGRLLFVQYGNYAEAWSRMNDGAAETYRDQFSSVAFVDGLADGREVTTVAFSSAAHDITLRPGLRSIGLAGAPPGRGVLDGLIDELTPDGIVCRTPHPPLIAACAARGIRTLPNFADIFEAKTLRRRARLWLLGRAIRRLTAPCVSNHSLNASRSLVTAVGIPAERVVPWDWQPLVPRSEAKTGLADPARPTLFYAGHLSEAKGVGDCIEAVALLHRDGIDATLSIAGGGDPGALRKRADALGITQAVRLLGTLSQGEVREGMASHDIVLVPSRHDYAEGLPNTIYEALASRSALVISDHPAFAGRLADGQDCVVFRAADPSSLADALRRLIETPALYRCLSENAPRALGGLSVGMQWTDLVSRFVDDPDNRTGWVAPNSLATLTNGSQAGSSG